MGLAFYGHYFYTDGDPMQVEYDNMICTELSQIFKVLW